MRGYVAVENSGHGKVPVESRTEIYRDPGDTEQILVETAGQTVPLSVADVTVSRKKGDKAPVVINPQSEFIEICNNGNSNGVEIISQGERVEVKEGKVETVRRDAKISIGYQTEMQLTIEREAKVEQNVVNEGSGDVVMGDSIDNSTSVGDDNVINRSDIGGQEPADVGSDNVMNRSSVGGGEASNPNKSHSKSADTTDHQTSPPEQSGTMYCIACGSEVGTDIAYCPNCGENLGEPDSPSAAMESSQTQNVCEHHQRMYTGTQCPECAEEATER